MASRRAIALAAAHNVLGRSPFTGPRSGSITVTNGTINWPREETTADPTVAAPLRRLQDLAEFAADPTVTLAAGAESVLQQCADTTDVSTLWRTSGVTEGDHAVDVAAPVLARWAPAALGDLLRRAYSEGRFRSDDAAAGLAFAIRRSLLILNAEQVDALAEVAAGKSRKDSKFRSCPGSPGNQNKRYTIAVAASMPDGRWFRSLTASASVEQRTTYAQRSLLCASSAAATA